MWVIYKNTNIEISEQLYTLRKQESTSSKCLLVTMLSAQMLFSNYVECSLSTNIFIYVGIQEIPTLESKE